jgi:hypothetical protein
VPICVLNIEDLKAIPERDEVPKCFSLACCIFADQVAVHEPYQNSLIQFGGSLLIGPAH